MQRKINKLKKEFRILKDWDIKYVKATKNNQACVGVIVDKKKAYIYGYGSKDVPEDYLFHEFLHIVFRAHRKLKKRQIYDSEEEIVQDICKIIVQNKWKDG